MDVKVKIQEALRSSYGDFDTYLEGKYAERITRALLGEDIEDKKEWATYNQVVVELKTNIKDMLRVKELQYRLTDIEDPNDVCIEVLEDIKNLSPELDRLYHKIKNFV
jgi:hypothetical protein